MIVVFDSCVWVSALRFGGVPMLALSHAYNYSTIACCSEIESEVGRTLHIKFGWSRESVLETMQEFLVRGISVPISGTWTNICRDPNDDMVVECAVMAKAEMIVSGDKDLRSLEVYGNIRIVSPAEYLKRMLAS